MIKELLRYRGDVVAIGNCRVTAGNGHGGAVDALIEAGADIEAHAGIIGRISLHTAALYGNCDAMLALLRQNADVSKRTQSGFRPLHEPAVGCTRKQLSSC